MEGVLGQIADLIRKGGVVMYPLIILSLISWVLIVERLVNLRASRFLPPNLNEVKLLLQKLDVDGAYKVISLNRDVFSRALSLVFEEYLKGNRSRADLNAILERELSGIVPAVEKNLMLLSAIASISPLLGLFGTITGLIKVFTAYATVQMEEATRLLSAGIGEALTAAATGLVVAIPALFAYWVFRGLGNDVIEKVEREAKEIMSLLEH
ncbi:MAG: MotA/TolQ/ExbB proton channel family protein [Aquificota bacterium]|nr:MotA/TolQ/ExbB proton channel family protein [Aquificota bacterium]MDQ7082365.1 MotA/TolQ/ExbB proton channel family protein [Aquificota bacterium]